VVRVHRRQRPAPLIQRDVTVEASSRTRSVAVIRSGRMDERLRWSKTTSETYPPAPGLAGAYVFSLRLSPVHR
jgi:hypothetical protein